jgi:serine/threonine protein kinase HipA of HipAB toxin-antitoxin module
VLSWVLLRQGRWEEAQSIVERKADALEPSFRRATPDQLAVYGNLPVAAATPAERRDRHDDATRHLTVAEAAATRSGPVCAYGSAFSPVDVRTQKVNTEHRWVVIAPFRSVISTAGAGQPRQAWPAPPR